jgi:protein-tyrosine phosphatase
MPKSPAPINHWLCTALVVTGVWLLASPAFADDIAHDRVIHLQGTSNTRDIGGYQTSDGHTLRWGQIIRSENLSRLTASDFQKLEELGVKTVIDLRTDREHDQLPTVWQGENPPRFYHFPIGDSHNDWFNAQRRLMKSSRFTQEQSLAHMEEGYRMIEEEGPPSFEKMMAVVLDESNWPILIHCSAGKDRAGVAAMIILETVGVDRDTIMQDFLLSNEVSRAEQKAVFLSKERKNSSIGKRSAGGASADAWFPIVGVEPEMLEAFYASVDEQYGSMDAFLNEIGVDQDARRSLAASLTTQLAGGLALGD